MKVLDLDLDFFLNGVAYFKDDDGKRLDSKFYKPWSQSQVRSFLEQKCGLSSPFLVLHAAHLVGFSQVGDHPD